MMIEINNKYLYLGSIIDRRTTMNHQSFGLRRKIRRIALLCIVLCLSTFVYAQTDIAFPKVLEMSPNAASIAQYQDCPVSYYSGTPEISIPLYEIDVDGFKLPITLSYHASGIRVAQEASWVGLGWALNVGGTISRTIKNFDDFLNGPDCDMDSNYGVTDNGIDDDHKFARKGFYYAPKLAYRLCKDNLYYPNTYKTVHTGESTSNRSFLTGIWHVYDNEPDIFNYSLPSYSGKFIFDNDKKVILLDKDHNLIFEPTYNKDWNCTFFTVTDREGNKYIFKDVEKTQNYHQKGALNKNGTDLYRPIYDNNPNNFWSHDVEEWNESWPQRAYKYVSCWCLSEIITNKNRHIYFTYEKEDQYLPTQESCERRVLDGVTDMGLSSYYQSKTVNEALRLKRIDCDFCHVTFSASDRSDIKTGKTYPSRKLDCISVTNCNGQHIKDITFDHDYFNSEKEGSDYDYVFMRLKLKSILDSSIGQPHVFSYYEDNSMPAKNSNNKDYWGYFNGGNYGAEYNVAAEVNGVYHKGVNKAANPKYTATYSLKEIKYPTGGKESFEYETHDIGSSFISGIPADSETDGYPIQTDFSIHLNNYHNTGLNQYNEDWPAEVTMFFEVTSEVRLSITCEIEDSGRKDPNFNYSYWFGEIQREDGSHYCWLWDEYPPTSEALNYGKKSSDPVWTVVKVLKPGIYRFCSGKLPEEVCASWKIDDGQHCSRIEVLSEDATVGKQSAKLINRKEIRGSSTNYGGGLRIKTIQTDMKKRSFSYSPGNVLVEPIFTYWSTYQQYHVATYLTSESLTSMSTFNKGYTVGYDCVTEITEDDDCPSYTKYYYKNDGEYELQDDNFPRGPINVNHTDGLLEKKEVYYDDVLVKMNEYDYTSTYSNRIEALYDRSENYTPDEHTTYYYTVEWPKLSKETETIYDANDENKKMVVTKTFKYNDHDLVSEEQTSDAISSYRNIIYYPFDFAQQQTIYKQMTDCNAICTPVEIVHLKGDAVIGATRANYQKLNNMFLIRTHDELDLKVPTNLSDYSKYYSCKETFDYFDNYGKLRQYRNSQGKLVTYLWGYNYLYPIAQIENMNYTNVAKLLGGEENVHTFLSRNNPNDSQVYTFLSPLMSVPNTYTNIYTYSPLIGMTSKVDVNGNKTYFKYNANSQLSSIKDNGQNIVQKFEYNYKK